jgi:hypothetical protein
VIALVVVYGLALSFVGPKILDATRALSGPGRCVVAGALILPMGLLLGAPLPAGLASVAERAPTRVPWLFGINSATSVLGSIVATMVAMHAGIAKTLLVGVAIYAFAAVQSFAVMKQPSQNET